MMKIFGPSKDVAALREAMERFENLSEADQMLEMQAQQISAAYSASNRIPKDEVAQQILTAKCGPKYANRVLSDPECRRKLGLH